jgi:hypothetical protein
MVNTPVDHTRKYAIELSMAQVDPSASFEERVAQFDLIWKRWLENISSLLTCARGSSLRNLPFPCLRGFHGHVVSAANEMPDDVVKFLENIFAKPLHTLNQDPGYSTRVTSMCPPPSNSKILVSI